MASVGFETMTAEFERAKIVHALDRVETVTGRIIAIPILNYVDVQHFVFAYPQI
jgi:predicted deacylase